MNLNDPAQLQTAQDAFQKERQRLLSAFSSHSDVHDLIDRGTIYADNLWTLVTHAYAAGKEGAGYQNVIDDIEVVVGKARSNVRTKQDLSTVDNIIDKLNLKQGGVSAKIMGASKVLMNETTLSIALGSVYSAIVGTSTRLASNKLFAALSLGGTAVAAGGIAGMREHYQLNRERAQHARETAQGQTFAQDTSPRRKEMEKVTHETVSASILLQNINQALTNNDAGALKKALVEANARVQFSDMNGVDLISYSDTKNITAERFALDIARATARQKLIERESNVSSTDMDAKLNEFRSNQENTDQLYKKMRRRRVAASAVKGAVLGTFIGASAQEAVASVSSTQRGLVEGIWGGGASGNEKSQTAIATMTDWVRGYISGGSGLATTITNTLTTNPSALKQQGANISSQNTPSNSAQHFLNQNPNTTQIKRDLWFDNDTPKPRFDKNELGIRWGGVQGTGMNAKGEIVLSVKNMAPGGSFHGATKINAQDLMTQGKLTAFISLSQGTQHTPVEVPVGRDGNIIIPKGSPLEALFTKSTTPKGEKMIFNGRFLEIAYRPNPNENTVRILATLEGKGLSDEVSITETPAEQPKPQPEDVPLEKTPAREELPMDIPIIPPVGHRPLEPTDKKNKIINKKISYRKANDNQEGSPSAQAVYKRRGTTRTEVPRQDTSQSQKEGTFWTGAKRFWERFKMLPKKIRGWREGGDDHNRTAEEPVGETERRPIEQSIGVETRATGAERLENVEEPLSNNGHEETPPSTPDNHSKQIEKEPRERRLMDSPNRTGETKRKPIEQSIGVEKVNMAQKPEELITNPMRLTDQRPVLKQIGYKVLKQIEYKEKKEEEQSTPPEKEKMRVATVETIQAEDKESVDAFLQRISSLITEAMANPELQLIIVPPSTWPRTEQWALQDKVKDMTNETRDIRCVFDKKNGTPKFSKVYRRNIHIIWRELNDFFGEKEEKKLLWKYCGLSAEEINALYTTKKTTDSKETQLY